MDSISIDQNNSNHIFSSPPEHRFADYAEIILLSLMLLAGCPLNALSLLRSLTRFSQGGNGGGWKPSDRHGSSVDRPSQRRFSQTIQESFRRGKSSRIFALIVHLTVANLMILLIYGASQIGWLITYSWKAPDWVCKTVKFLQALCFYGTSNLMVAVAVERLYIALNVDRPRCWRERASDGPRLLSKLPWIGWILATISALPQLFLWSIYAPYKHLNPDWYQCVDVWSINSRVYFNKSTESIYVGIHLALVFWLPMLIILSCYAMVIALINSKLRRNFRSMAESKRQCDAAVLRRRAEQLHRASYCSTEGANGTDTDRRHSIALLMDVPVALEGARVFSVSATRRSTLINEHSGAVLITTLTRARRSAVRKITFVLVAYLLCWAPYNVMALWRYIEPNKYVNSGLEYLYNFIVLNAVINPLLYGC